MLPSPPTTSEKDEYLRTQSRWVLPLQFLGLISICISMVMFIAHTALTTVLLVPVVITLLTGCISLATATRRRRMSLSEHRTRVTTWSPDAYPSVDVFLPSAGEDLPVLANTYTHVAAMRWSGALTVYVLDDSARPAVRQLALRSGFRYLTRPDRGRMKKAGNLKHGFENSSGDLITVFDADFCPRSDFLGELVPYLDDPKVGITQSPQYFDVSAEQNWLQRAAGATQIFFYRWVQQGRDASRAPICVGTNAVYRRAALMKSGGFAQIGHSEDVHTGVNLLKAGYETRYVATNLAKGLCPDGFDQFLVQQYRWCTGSMSLLFSRAFHQLPLTPMQRLCFWTGFLYYITTGVNVFLIWIPPLVIGFFKPSAMHSGNYVFVVLALLIRASLVPIITMQRGTWLGLARIQIMYSFAHGVGLFDVLRRKPAAWVATGAARRTPLATRIRRVMVGWIAVMQAAMWIAILWRAPTYGLDNYWPMILFACLAAAVVTPIILGRTEPLRRRGPRPVDDLEPITLHLAGRPGTPTRQVEVAL